MNAAQSTEGTMNATSWTGEGEGATLGELFTAIRQQFDMWRGDEPGFPVSELRAAEERLQTRRGALFTRTNLELDPGRPLLPYDLERIARVEV
jgi:hypothetical protein